MKLFRIRKDETEKPKVALDKDRKNACIRSLVHVVPLAGALVLIWLNSVQYFVGTNLEGTVGLQFAAKLHELTMIASLTTVMMSYMRHRLTSRDGVPFGAAFAGLQVSQLSYLWSPEFYGSLTSRSYPWIVRLQLALSIIVISLLIAAVGPSSAACMIPRQGSWPVRRASGSFTLNTSDAVMYPTNLTTALYDDQSCFDSSLAPTQDGPFYPPCSYSQLPYGNVSLISLLPLMTNISLEASAAAFSDKTVTGAWLTAGNPLTLSMRWKLLEGDPATNTTDYQVWNATSSTQNQAIAGLAYVRHRLLTIILPC